VKPLISYLVSTYNGARFLHGRLNNLLNEQTEKAIEVVIVNPNSPGADGAIAEYWTSIDSRVRYIEVPFRETYGSSWLRAWKAAAGEFVCNANVDDKLHPEFSTKMYSYMSSMFNKVGFGYSDIHVVRESDLRVVGISSKKWFDLDTFSYECHAGPAVMWRNSESFNASLDWTLMEKRATQHVSAFDYWLWLYMCSLGYYGCVLKEALVWYLQRPDSIEHQNYGGASTYESLASISEFFPHHFRNRLKEFKEFVDFSNLPPKDEWVAKRLRGEKWSH
jgi:glycosyltransferase involved in cell wall biosynthesis